MLKHAQNISKPFSPSPQCIQFLKKKITELKHQKPASSSTKRWVERISNLDGFVEAFEAIFYTLKYMKKNEKGDFDSSTSDTRMLYKSIKPFELNRLKYLTSCIVLYYSATTKKRRGVKAQFCVSKYFAALKNSNYV